MSASFWFQAAWPSSTPRISANLSSITRNPSGHLAEPLVHMSAQVNDVRAHRAQDAVVLVAEVAHLTAELAELAT